MLFLDETADETLVRERKVYQKELFVYASAPLAAVSSRGRSTASSMRN